MKHAGIDTYRKFLNATPAELSAIPGVEYHEFAEAVLESLRNSRP
jgi:hypothetical protein